MQKLNLLQYFIALLLLATMFPAPVRAQLPLDEAGAALSGLLAEERFARDVYLSLGNLWGQGIFFNIAQAEQTHMDTVAAEMTRRGLPLPADTPGQFSDPLLAGLWQVAMDFGGSSLENALVVGAAIEEMDLRDLEGLEARLPELAPITQALAFGSRNHLRAFTGQLQRRGVTYTPIFTDQATVDRWLVTH